MGVMRAPQGGNGEGDDSAVHVKGVGRPRVRRSRGWSLETAAREFVWLWDSRHGTSFMEIANREGVTPSRVRFGVARARSHERSARGSGPTHPPRLSPLFPVGPYTPTSPCGHDRPIRIGSSLCCMVCHVSGLDGHPAFARDPKTDPAPEPPLPETPLAAKPAKETRKQKRKRLQEAKGAGK